VDYELFPSGGFAGLSWQGRNNLLDSLQMQLALAFYRVRGDAGPLQVETLQFLQNAVDGAYAEGVNKYEAGKLDVRRSREEAIGNFMDRAVRLQLRDLFNRYQIGYGPGADITINNRDYDTSDENDISYKVPDARVANVSFDWTLTLKTMSTPQIQGFFRADSRPAAVIIVRPNQLGQNSTYLIPRPIELRPKR
jgi:hypothetical protein